MSANAMNSGEARPDGGIMTEDKISVHAFDRDKRRNGIFAAAGFAIGQVLPPCRSTHREGHQDSGLRSCASYPAFCTPADPNLSECSHSWP